MTRLEKIQIACIIGGIVLVLSGANWDLPWLVDIGLLLAGAGVLSSGVDTLVTRRVGFWSRITRDLYGDGLRALLSGIMLTLVGGWIWALASVRLLGIATQTWSFLISHPSVILLNIAPVLLLLGAFGLLRLEGWRMSLGSTLRAAPIVLVSGFLLLAGITVLTIGLYALIDPTVLNFRVSSWLPPFNSAP